MIVPMKKVSLLVQSKDAESAIERLRSLGVVHVEHQQAPKGRRLNSLQEDVGLIDAALVVLQEAEYSDRKYPQVDKLPGEWKFVASHIIDLHKRIDQLEDYTRGLVNGIIEWEQWGDFDPALINALRDKNVYLRLYRIPVKHIKDLPAGVIVKQLSASRGIASCVIISREKVDIPFRETALPRIGLEKMRARLSEARRLKESIEKDIARHVCYRGNFLRVKKSLGKQTEFYETLNGMGQSGNIMYLTGYIPGNAAELLIKASKREKWGVVIDDPREEDRVPTLIRNPRWISIINPVFKVIEVVPGYHELDISLWFLLFFSVFFGMLIGDAGYGLIFFVLTLLARKKWGGRLRDQSAFTLFYILSLCAIIWGGLTGTFFGQEWLPQTVRPLIPGLRNDRNVQALCFFLGAVHLSIAHLWRVIIKLPSIISLAEAGWILILWRGFFLAKLLILGDVFPPYGKWLFICGMVLIILFTSPRKNVLRGIGVGLGNLVLNLVNSFTDVVSYIRLFAVGLATVAVADAFNKMAMSIGYNGIIAGLLTSFILLLGHTLNILLGPMAVLVHGLRLNVLEFCNHLDIKWSGFTYRPLKE